MAYVVYDDQAIWGLGETKAAAWKEAREYAEVGHDDMECAEASDALAAEVRKNGGNCAFELVDGILKLVRRDWRTGEVSDPE